LIRESSYLKRLFFSDVTGLDSHGVPTKEVGVLPHGDISKSNGFGPTDRVPDTTVFISAAHQDDHPMI
jgi:hypothetical protein